jgi:RNA polymerase sigma-70 factor (ECF subfamily)
VPAEELLPDVTEIEAGWDPWPAVDERVDGAATVQAAVMGLRPAEREVLTLVVWEDLSVVDAARALGIPSGTAYRYLHQARVALRCSPGMVELLTDRHIVTNSK